MITKEIVKNKIDNLPEYLLKNLYTYIDSITIDIKKKKKLKLFTWLSVLCGLTCLPYNSR